MSEASELEMGPSGDTVQHSSFTFPSICNAAFPLFQFSIPEILSFMQPHFFDLNQLTRCFAFAVCEGELQETSSGDGRASFSKL